jgi:hypothetical protein
MNIGPGKGHKETGKIDYTLLIWLFFIIISLQPVIRQKTLEAVPETNDRIAGGEAPESDDCPDSSSGDACPAGFSPGTLNQHSGLGGDPASNQAHRRSGADRPYFTHAWWVGFGG